MASEGNLDQTLQMLDQHVEPGSENDIDEARSLAARFDLPFDPLDEFHVDVELFRTIPVDVMLRYQFLPQALEDGVLRIVMAFGRD